MRKRTSLILTAILSLSIIFTPEGNAMESTGGKVVSTASNYIGTPYRIGGVTPAGFDCSGFTTYIFKKMGMSLPRTSRDQFTVGTPVSKANLQAGDLVFFKTTGASIGHVGIYIGNNKFISSTSTRGIKIDSLYDPYYWGGRYVGAKRVLKEEVKPTATIAVELAPGEFYDLPSSNWAYESVLKLANEGIINGNTEGHFQPNKLITRAEIAKLIIATLGLDTETNFEPFYSDVTKDHWAASYITAATQYGFFSDFASSEFKPNQPVTRAEAAAVLTRTFQLAQSGETVAFTDLSSDHWAYSYIQTIVTNKIANGYEDKTFKAAKEITRAEFAALLYNAINK